MVEEIDLFPMEKLAAELSRPMLILHGMLDTVVPYQVSLTFMEQAVCPHIELRLFKDGDHRLLAYKDELAESAWANGYAGIRVHGRTVEQKYLGAADWSFLREVKRRYPERTKEVRPPSAVLRSLILAVT